MKKEKKHILPDADLLSAMESLKVYGGKGNPLDPQDTNYGCTNTNCPCNDPEPKPNTVKECTN